MQPYKLMEPSINTFINVGGGMTLGTLKEPCVCLGDGPAFSVKP